MEDVFRAINHVHKDVDTQNQWIRAVKGMRELTNLEVGRVWVRLSNQACKLDTANAIILHSQLLELFKLCVDEARSSERLEVSERDCTCTETHQVLEECKRALMHNIFIFGRMYIKTKRTGRSAADSDSEYDESKKIDGGREENHTPVAQTPEPSLQSSLSSIELQIGKFQTKLLQHESRLDEIFGSVSSLAELAKSIPDEDARKQEQAELTSAIHEMTDAIEQQHAAQEVRYQEFKKQTSEVNAQHEGLIALNVEFHEALTKTNLHFLKNLESVSAKITQVSQTMVDISATSSDVNAAVRVDLESLHQQYDAMQSEMKAKFDGKHSAYTGEEHKKTIDELVKGVMEAKDQIDTLNTHTQQDIDAVKKKANDIMTHIRNLESRQRLPKASPELELFPVGSTVDESRLPSASKIVKDANAKSA